MMVNSTENIQAAIEVYLALRRSSPTDGWDLFVQVIKSASDQGLEAGYRLGWDDRGAQAIQQIEDSAGVNSLPFAELVRRMEMNPKHISLSEIHSTAEEDARTIEALHQEIWRLNDMLNPTEKL